MLDVLPSSLRRQIQTVWIWPHINRQIVRQSMASSTASTEPSATADQQAATTLELLPAPVPPYYWERHRHYVANLFPSLETSMEGAWTEHLRISGVYWSVTAWALLSEDDSLELPPTMAFAGSTSLLDWVLSCYDESSGGFGGNTGQEGHLLYTLSALQVLALLDALDRLTSAQRDKIIDFCVGLQQPNGSFVGDAFGEVDTRFTYCALQALALLNALDRIRRQAAVDFLVECQNFDGGFGSCPGAESHAGQVFCCVGALAIAEALHVVDTDLLAWWLAERQVDSGGLNGRPEKQADVCYSWWISSAASILGRLSWIDGDKLARFILKCQDDVDGGIADRPDDMVDVYHTFFGIAGLSLLGCLHIDSEDSPQFLTIDPLYALPTSLVKRMGLPGQVIREPDGSVANRLSHYKVL